MIDACLMVQLQKTSRDEKMLDITTTILDELNSSCPECGISNKTIDTEQIKCFFDSPSHMTYCARLEGTSQADSLSLISLIEDWVESGGASVAVTGVILRIDSQCSVVISSLSEGECSPTTQPPLSSPSLQPYFHFLPVPN